MTDIASSRPATTLTPELQQLVARLVNDEVGRRTEALEGELANLRDRLTQTEGQQVPQKATLLVFSNDIDRLLSAFIIATGSVAMGLDVSMYFTFWGLTALKKKTTYRGKGPAEKMLSLMLPADGWAAQSSTMNMGGAGPLFLKHLMEKNNVESVPQLLALSQELGVRLIACKMAMGVMGITEEELIDDIEYGGVATYVGSAADSRITLFV